MIVFYLTIPLMLLAVAVAVLPVLVGSFRNHRPTTEGNVDTPKTRAQEANFWHQMLGHCKAEEFGPISDMVDDNEVLRVVPAGRPIDTEPTAWASKPRSTDPQG